MNKHLFTIGDFGNSLAVALVEETFWLSQEYVDMSESTLTQEELRTLGLGRGQGIYEALPGITEEELRLRMIAVGFEESEEVSDWLQEEMAEAFSDWTLDDETGEWKNPEDEE